MTGYRRKLIAAAMMGFVSVGVFAQKGKGNKPPKTGTKVVVVPKREKPPQNSNQDKRGGKRERPEEEY